MAILPRGRSPRSNQCNTTEEPPHRKTSRSSDPGCRPASVGSIASPKSSIGEPGHFVVECEPRGFWRTQSSDQRSQPMDGTAATLQEKLDQLLHQAAEVSVALDRVNGTIVGIPHYSVIETRAHELGQQLSRLIQARQMGQFAAHAADFAPCPECGTRCQ